MFDAFSHGQQLAELSYDLGLARPLVWQPMYSFKQPGIGGEVGWHQGATFFETSPISVTTFWFALEDTTQDNGCLWAEPGGHRGPLREHFVRHGDVVSMQKLNAASCPITNATAVPLEVKAGSLVVFHGLLPHYSAPNRSSKSRHAYNTACDRCKHCVLAKQLDTAQCDFTCTRFCVKYVVNELNFLSSV